MNRFYTDEIQKDFGDNLNYIFSGTRSMASCSPSEWDKIESAVRKCKLGRSGKIDTSEWGTKSYEYSLYTLIEFLANCKDSKGVCVFADFKLPEYTEDTSVKGFDPNMGRAPQSDAFFNYGAQRTINALNIVKILFNFNPALVFGAKGRKDSKGNYFINDGQHGTLLLGICGVETLPIAYIESDDTSIDYDHFLAFNVDNYEAEDYDKHRNQVQRAVRMKDEGKNLYPSDKTDYGLHRVLQRHNITLCPKSKTNLGEGESVHVAHFLKYFAEHVESDAHDEPEKESRLDRAFSIMRRAFRAHHVPQEPVWGLLELIKAQGKLSSKEWEKWEDAMVRALKAKWPGSPDIIWKETLATMNRDMPKKDAKWRDDHRVATGNRGYMIGSAFREVYNAFEEIRRSNGDQRPLVKEVKPIVRDDGQEYNWPKGYPTGNMLGSVTELKEAV